MQELRKMIFAVTEKGRNDMARCEDCLHYEVCKHHAKMLEEDGYEIEFDDTLEVEKQCGAFKPTADVVPKSEYDAVVSAVDNSTKEFLKLHDTYQKQNVEIEALKIANEKMYIANKAQEVKNEWLEKELDSKQFRCDSCDRIMLTGAEHRACVKQAKADVAREIFAEIENILDPMIQLNYAISVQHADPIERAKAISAEQALRAFRDYVAELKKKYTEGEPNGHV